MSEVTAERAEEQAEATAVDFGQALGALLRTYLDNARAAVSELPGGPRGFQVMSIASTSACSNQARIAEAMGLDRTVMTYLLDDLEKAGLVARRPDPADRRARQVVLTKKGAKTFETAANRIQHVERSVLGGLSDADAALFRDLLTKVVVAGPVEVSGHACTAEAPTC
jgi:DNA-binding MarR family transcriptional regulator